MLYDYLSGHKILLPSSKSWLAISKFVRKVKGLILSHLVLERPDTSCHFTYQNISECLEYVVGCGEECGSTHETGWYQYKRCCEPSKGCPKAQKLNTRTRERAIEWTRRTRLSFGDSLFKVLECFVL